MRSRRFPLGRAGIWLLIAVLAGSYHWCFAFKGWIPHDEGLLAHSAERVLQRQWPHIDFDDMYTGGLSLFHALGFLTVGRSVRTLRLLVLIVFACTTPLIYFISRRFLPLWVAALVTGLGVVWTLPCYPAAMPSWYVLFLAYVAVACLMAHAETGKRRYLFDAGLAVGAAVVVKITGLYLVAALGLYLLYRERVDSSSLGGRDVQCSRLLAWVKALLSAVLTLALIYLIRTQLAFSTLFMYVLPPGAVAAWLVWDEARHGCGTSRQRLRSLRDLVGPFVAGVLAPVSVLALVYLFLGGLGDWLRGVFILPLARTSGAAMPPPPFWRGLAVLPFAGMMCWLWSRSDGKKARVVVVGFALLLFVICLASASRNPYAYRLVWYSLRPLGPVVTVFGLACAFREQRRGDLARSQWLFLLTACTAFLGLVQFPYAFGVYLCYFVPFVWLTWAACAFSFEHRGGRLAAALSLAFFLLFAAVVQNHSSVRTIGVTFRPMPERVSSGIEGLDVDVQKFYAAMYYLVTWHVGRFAADDEYIYAGPDCPEVYFLSRKRNPFRTLYEVFRPVSATELMAGLEKHGVNLVVLNKQPEFSPRPTAELITRLAARYPHRQEVAWMLVMWRQPDHAPPL